MESDAVVYRPNPDLPVCAGTWHFVDRFTNAFAATLPAGRQLDGPITYQFLTPDEVADVCPGESYACADRGVVYSPSPADLHEIVHAVRHRVYGGSVPGPSLLEEGLAVSFYSADGDSREFGHLSQTALAAVGSQLYRDDYPGAGHFASFIIARHGEAAFQDFVFECAGARELPDYSAPYMAATGSDLGADLDAYYASPDCPPHAFVSRPVECGAEPVVVLEASAPTGVQISDFSCESADAVGPHLGRAWSHIVVENPGDSSLPVQISFESSSDEAAELFRADVAPCGFGCPDNERSFAFSSKLAEPMYVELDPGRSVLRFAIDVEMTTTLELTFTPEN